MSKVTAVSLRPVRPQFMQPGIVRWLCPVCNRFLGNYEPPVRYFERECRTCKTTRALVDNGE